MFEKIVEGQFGGQGDKPKGVLGAIQRHWLTVNNRARGMGVTEEWMARAIVRGLLETAGAVEDDGRMVLSPKDEASGLNERISLIGQSLDDLRRSYTERIEALEQDIGGLKMLIADLRALISAQDVMLQTMIESVSAIATQDTGRIEKLEKMVAELEAARAADAKRFEEFVQTQTVRIERDLVVSPQLEQPALIVPVKSSNGRKAATPAPKPDVVVPPEAEKKAEDDKW